eukprot:Opistho-2@27764
MASTGRCGPPGTASDPLDDQGDALTHPDAHGAQGIASARAMQLVDGGGDQASAAGAQRVTQGNGAAVRVDAGVIVGQAQLAQHGQALGGEGFVQLDHVHLRQAQAGQG